MPRILACPACKSRMRVPDDSGGCKTRCPKCGSPLRVPVRRPPAPRPAGAPVRTAGVVPAVDEVVLGEDSVDVVEEAAPAAAPLAEIDLAGEDDVIVVEDEAPVDDDVEVVEDEPSPLAAAEEFDPFEGQDVPESMQQDVRAELTRGEKIAWVGRPSMTLMRANAAVAAIVGVVLALVGIGLLAGTAFAPSGMHVVAFGVFGLVFLAFGGLLLFARFWASRSASSRSVYVLTNRRALVFNGKILGKVQLRSYTVARVKDMQRKDSGRLKGAGDLIFETERIDNIPGPSVLPGSRPTRGPRVRTHEVHHGFLMLENVKAVEKLVRETLIDRALDKALAPET